MLISARLTHKISAGGIQSERAASPSHPQNVKLKPSSTVSIAVPTGGLLFLGAGASKPFGPPTMPEYPNLFRNFLEQREPSLLQVYDGLRDVLRAFPEGNDLEALYSILQDLKDPQKGILNPAVAYQLSAVKNLSVNEVIEVLGSSKLGQSAALLSLLEEFIHAACEIKDEAKLLRSYDQLLDGSTWSWSKKVPGGTMGIGGWGRTVTCRTNPPGWIPEVPIVTTNYDLAVERYLRYRQADVNDGFEKNPGGRVLLTPSVLRAETQSPAIKLIKLHGSIDWRKTADGEVILGEGRIGTVTRRWESIIGDAIVFPTRNKSTANRPFFELLSIFADFLREKQFWLVIGYSFRDENLRRLFLDTLGEERYLVVMSPHASRMVDTLRNEATPPTSREHIVPVDAEFGDPDGMKRLRDRLREGL